ncbi:MAG: M4 family metallopeptidase [Anaerolineae bacterium]
MLALPLKRSYLVLVFLALALLLASSVAPVTMRSLTAGLDAITWSATGARPLAVTPAAPVETHGDASGPRDAFQSLQARAGGALDATWDSVYGIPTFVVGHSAADRIPYTPTAAERGDTIAVAYGFLDENRALFRIASAQSELRVRRVEPDLQLNFSHIRLEQTYKGIPVWGRQIVVHLDPQARIVAVNGQFAPDIAVATQPTISPGEAEAAALDDLLGRQLTDDERARMQTDTLKDKTQLVVYVDDGGKATLTWLVTIMTTSPLGQWRYFVNGRREAVAHQFDSIAHGKRRMTYASRSGGDIPGRLMVDEGERSNDAIAQAAHDAAGKVYDFYFSNFKRDSVDGQGSPLVSTVHFGTDPSDQENAAWIGEAKQMVYGDGGRIFKPLAYGLDVVGHEFTHGVIDSSAELVYAGQSGALNESYADVFGVLISGTDWEVGGSVVKSPPYPTRILRSLADPGINGNYDPRNALNGIGQPAHMREYANLPLNRRADNGGVHVNSGIPNKAAYLLGQAIGRDKLTQVYYRALTQYLTPRADFQAAANATARAAQDLYGDAEANAARTAWSQVGVNVGGPSTPTQAPQRPAKSGGAPVPPPQLPQGCGEIVNDGSFETDGAWVEVSGKGNTGIIDTEEPHTGARSAWLGGTDKESPQYVYQTLRIPANATQVILSYNRLIHEETSGLLGIFSDDARFSTLVADTQGNILGAIERVPSSQGDDRWKEARFDVTELAGKDVRLLFAMENPRGNISSAFIDDVSLAACTTGAPPAAPATSSDNLVYIKGKVVDADTRRGVAGAQVFILKPGITATQAAADDQIKRDEVLATGVADNDGVYQTDQPAPKGQAYSVIVFARGYRPIIADNGVNVPANANNPYAVDATLRRAR